MTHAAKVFARFSGPEIFLEQGRLIFSVLHTFATAGLQVHLFDNLADKDIDKYGKLVYSTRDVVLTREIPSNPAEYLYLYDQPDEVLRRHAWTKTVQVRFDMFAPFWTSNPIIMPFPMHPLQSGVTPADLAVLRPSERRMRIFFSGDTHHYGRAWVRHPKTKLPRLQIVHAIKERLVDDLVLVHDTAALQAVRQAGCSRKCVITASSEVRIEFADWLGTLAQADFFLSPPGIVMPMCHNIVEAMAVGTIPITNYPEWMDPHLEPGRNCLAFDEADDLIAALRRALAMDPAEIARMKANVIDYYEEYLRPQTFVDRVLASPDKDLPILIYTERNMAKNPTKLGRHSILMKGTTQPRPGQWFKRVLASYLG
jgi:Glycosyl transferases group 1